ncbi:MAG: nuclear transport factor 2 family protein [Defluviitaleaceae bacterium]|nr:nuclear transport factor 2 family protein [Defluviitaleaceae bacterium]
MHEALEQYINATNTHDFAEVSKCVHKDAVYYFTDRTCAGIDEIKAYFEKGWATIADEKYWATDVNYILQTSSTMVCTYNFNYAGYVNGKYAEGSGRATNVFAKEDEGGSWKLLHEHLSRIR